MPIPKEETLDDLNALLLEMCDAYATKVLGDREDRRTIQERAIIEQKTWVLIHLTTRENLFQVFLSTQLW